MGLSRDVWQNVQLAATELKKNGKFKLGGVLNTKLKKKPAKAAHKGGVKKSLKKAAGARVAKEEVRGDGQQAPLLKMALAMKVMKKPAGATGLTVSAAFTKAVESTELKQHAANKQFWKEYSVCANALHRANAVLKKHAHDEKHTSLMQTAQVLLSERPKMPAN